MKIQKYNVKKIRRKDIGALINYIPLFTSKCKFGEHPTFIGPSTAVCSTLSDGAEDFYQACYKHNFVQPFDWNSWLLGNEHLVFRGEGIENCDLETLGKLLTTHVRGDRFNDGHLLEVMESGAMGRILIRLKEISGIKVKPKPEWRIGEVNKDKDHFILYYGDVNKIKLSDCTPVAMIGRPVNGIYNVKWLVDQKDLKFEEAIKHVCKDLDFYFVELGKPDPWEYAKYHCTTASNIYSHVHWSHIDKKQD